MPADASRKARRAIPKAFLVRFAMSLTKFL
jgi:hypothetical protein